MQKQKARKKAKKQGNKQMGDNQGSSGPEKLENKDTKSENRIQKKTIGEKIYNYIIEEIDKGT